MCVIIDIKIDIKNNISCFLLINIFIWDWIIMKLER